LDDGTISREETTLGAKREPFSRCGLAALSDFQTPQWHQIFSTLEREQTAFLSKQNLFRTPEYKWPLDALHQWSRAWEYPYVYFHLLNWRRSYDHHSIPSVADIGSGVTFFPFSVARLGCRVICADPDPICRRDLTRAAEVVDHRPGEIEFRLIDTTALPLKTSECDSVYCISVLEHIETFNNTLREIHRTLKAGGLFYLTIDLDLQGNSDIRVDRYDSLMADIHELFEIVWPDVTIHPADMLSNVTGPYRMYDISKWRKAKYVLKHELINPLLGRGTNPPWPMHLAVQGSVLRKRE
jgi:SAM-dependent methyltransferase